MSIALLNVFQLHNVLSAGGKRPLVKLTKLPHMLRKRLVSKLRSSTPNDMPRKSNSKRRSKPTTSETSSRQTPPRCPMERYQLTCSIVRVNKMPKPFLPPSSRSGKKRLPNMLCHCLKLEASPKMKCSRCSRLANPNQRRGSAWSPKLRLLARTSHENRSKWRGLFGQWPFDTRRPTLHTVRTHLIFCYLLVVRAV